MYKYTATKGSCMITDYSDEHGHLPGDGLVPIRTVSSLTGVNPVTLRAWERRYGLIKPVRTPKGHRLYTMSDVDLIQQAVTLLESGMSIGQVGQVLQNDRTLKATDKEEVEEPSDSWTGYQRRLMQAVSDFDEVTLNDIYNEVLSLYPVDIVTSRLIVPLLRELGWRWQQASGGIAEEHFFSVFLRNKLGARFHHRSRDLTGPRLLAACLPGEQHEVGLLLFALAAVDRDYRVVLLGANMPLADLPAVVQRVRCQGLVLSGSAEVPAAVIEQELPAWLPQLTIPVFIGGRVTERHRAALAALPVISLSDDFTLALRKLDSVLNRR
jgi:DNA-binding transcriptional MerR regulator